MIKTKFLKPFALFAFIVFLLVGCKKDKNDTPTLTANYQPTKAGSTWQYETENKLSSAKTTFVVSATGRDSSINGKTYKVFTNSSGSNDYYIVVNNDYYQFGGIAGITASTELLYLKSDAAAGTTWQDSKTGLSIPGIGSADVKLSYTLVEKIASMTVGANTYTDVLHVKVDLSDIKVGGLPIPISDQNIHFYYAPNIGRIKSQIKMTLTPPFGSQLNIDNETSLKTAIIVP